MRRVRLAVVGALALAALAGCNDTPTAPTGPPTTPSSVPITTAARSTEARARPAACSVVTADDVRAAVSVAMEETEGEQGTPDGTSICTYRTADRLLLVRLNRQSGDRDHAAFPYGPPTPVAGLGDDARFHAGQGDTLSALSVVRGTVGLTVLYRGPGDHLAITTALARSALPRL